MKPFKAPHITNLLKDSPVFYHYPDWLSSQHWTLKRPKTPSLAEAWTTLLQQARSHAKVQGYRSFGFDYATRSLVDLPPAPKPPPRWSGVYADLADLSARINEHGDIVRLNDFQPGYLLAFVRAGFRLGEPVGDIPCALILDGVEVLGLLMKMRPLEV